MRLHARLEAHGVVEAGLDVAGTMRGSAIVLGNAQLDGGVATLEVPARGHHKNTNWYWLDQLHADDVAVGDDERRTSSDAPNRTTSAGMASNDALPGDDEPGPPEKADMTGVGEIGEYIGVHFGTEAHDGPIGGGIGLEPLEDLLAIMEDARALRQRDAVIGGQGALIPCAVLVVGHIAIVGLAIAEIEVSPVQVLLLNGHGELLTRCGHPRRRRPLNIKARPTEGLCILQECRAHGPALACSLDCTPSRWSGGRINRQETVRADAPRRDRGATCPRPRGASARAHTARMRNLTHHATTPTATTMMTTFTTSDTHSA